MKRFVVLLAILAAFIVAWSNFRIVPLVVIGQPTSTGAMQQQKERPFFENLAAATGLPLEVRYEPLERVGFKDTYQLPMLRDGQFDLVSLRFVQNSDTEPSLQGIDVIGLSTDYVAARRVARQYSTVVDRYLRQNYDATLLGVWTFGPQVFLCSKPIRGIDDIAGLKVRVSNSAMAALIAELGGTPAVISFDDTRNALAIGLVDCAITSAASANFAGWPKHTQVLYRLPVQFGLNGYAISLKAWGRFSASEQQRLRAAFDRHLDDLWDYSQEVDRDSTDCTVGRPCRNATPYRLQLIEPSVSDIRRFQEVARSQVWPQWQRQCDEVHPGCSAEWEDLVMEQVR